jgi:hypothetical protein
VRQRASKCAPENASGCHCLWRSRRGRSQPQRVRQTRPRVRHRLPMRPARRLGFGRSGHVTECEGRAMARRCVAPEGVRCDLSAASHGSSPRFARRAADNPWSARAQDGASPPFGFHSVRIQFRIRFAFKSAFDSQSISHSVRIQFSIQFAFGSVSIRVPRLAQQGHDLALSRP